MRRKFAFHVVLAILLALAGGTSLAVDKLIRVPIHTDYGVTDPAFTNSISGLLRTPMVGGNKIVDLNNGVEYFPAMLSAIASAQKTITFENFIWRSGQVSDRFIEALAERARAGVKVHCIVDGFGALKLKNRDKKRLTEAGVELKIFNRIRPWNLSKWNHRTHRKTLVIDGKVGFMGGICIANEWDGNAESQAVWRDIEFKVEGPVVSQIQSIFMDNWIRTSSEVLHGPDYFPSLTNEVGNSMAQAFKSGPKDGAENARLMYLYSIAAAKKNIRFCHSYFVPDDLAIQMLVEAAQRGVKIEVIAPGFIDKNMVRRAARSRWQKMMDAGIEFWEFQPAKLHNKLMIVDDAWVTCGSINFDDRSFRINDEGNINILDHEFAKRQIEVFEADKKNSVRIDPAKFKKRPLIERIYENFCNLFRSQL
jgi:cardiolipin synthase A/B